MKSKYLITKNQHEPFMVPTDTTINVMELFYDTIQGEGVSKGVPAVFLRLQGCTLDCVWCDTEWRKGNIYSFNYLYDKMQDSGVVERLYEGHHLVITGGSPLKQQDKLITFLNTFQYRFGFYPFTEVENECTLHPDPAFIPLVDQWNNSPKLSNSGMKERARLKPEVLMQLSMLPHSWFKFVVESPDDWDEITRDFIEPDYIKRDQIILMPLGDSIDKIQTTMGVVVDIAIRNNVRFTNREQIILNKP